MRAFHLQYVYNILWLISISSSLLLFLLVACENSQNVKHLDSFNASVDSNKNLDEPNGYNVSVQINDDGTDAKIVSSLVEQTVIFQNSGVSSGLPDQSEMTLINSQPIELPHSDKIFDQTSNDQSQTTNTTVVGDTIPVKDIPEDSKPSVKIDEISKNDAFTAEKNDGTDKNDAMEGKKTDNFLDTKVENSTLIVDAQPRQNESNDEDIPSFAEWAQKQLEEAQQRRKDTELNASLHYQQQAAPSTNRSHVNIARIPQKNYASPICGAKIIAHNPEANNPSAVLNPSGEEYMLNKCADRIWFIAELCEAIQIKKVQLANFELFSSTPKGFTVFISDRFPTRDWTVIGNLVAEDRRDLQNFPINTHFFGKYIKFELNSHYGAEHFCPLSIFTVFGTSEFEALETDDDDRLPSSNAHLLREDDDDESDYVEVMDEKVRGSNNLFGSARDAVMSFVKKAVQIVLISDSTNRTQQRTVNCSLAKLPITEMCQTPSHVIVCENCNDTFFSNVYGLLSCRSKPLTNLLKSLYVREHLPVTCEDFGLSFNTDKNDVTISKQWRQKSPLIAFFGSEYIAALCNLLAIREKKVVWNVSNLLPNQTTHANQTEDGKDEDEKKLHLTGEDSVTVMSSSTIDSIMYESTILAVSEHVTTRGTIATDSFTSAFSDIQPSRSSDELEPAKITQPVSIAHTTSSTSSKIDVELNVDGPNDDEINGDILNNLNNEMNGIVPDQNQFDTSYNNASIDALDDELSGVQTNNQNQAILVDFEVSEKKPLDSISTAAPIASGHTSSIGGVVNGVSLTQQKESAFLRLHNRIKAVERNLSLSSQYLEELSRRYKRQMEEVQRAFDKRGEYEQKSDDRYDLIERRLDYLSTLVEDLLTERKSWWYTLSWFIHILITQLCIAVFFLYFCIGTGKKSDHNVSTPVTSIVSNNKTSPLAKRRKSLDVIRHATPARRKRRRRSDEALPITGTYTELIVPDNHTQIASETAWLTKNDKKRRRRKNFLLQRSFSDASNHSTTFGATQNGFVNLFENIDIPSRVEEVTASHDDEEQPKNESKSKDECAGNQFSFDELRNSNAIDGLSVPKFMKTAISERNRRMSSAESLDVKEVNEVSQLNATNKLKKDEMKILGTSSWGHFNRFSLLASGKKPSNSSDVDKMDRIKSLEKVDKIDGKRQLFSVDVARRGSVETNEKSSLKKILKKVF